MGAASFGPSPPSPALAAATATAAAPSIFAASPSLPLTRIPHRNPRPALRTQFVSPPPCLDRLLLRPLPIPSSPLPPLAAHFVGFHARREVNVPFVAGSLPAEDYVKEVERVVKITFPDSTRISYLGNHVWRAVLKPVTFFTICATPVCDIRVCHENSALRISSNKLILDFIGLPDQFRHLDLRFSLLGELSVAESSLPAIRKGRDKTFRGWVALGLEVDLPLPFSMMPEAIVTPVGDGILDRILGAMEGALLAGLIGDYNTWCRKPTVQPSPSPNMEVYIRG